MRMSDQKQAQALAWYRQQVLLGAVAVPGALRSRAQRRVDVASKVGADLNMLGFTPLKLYQCGSAIDLAVQTDALTNYSRPFVVLKVRTPHKTRTGAVYKTRVADDPTRSAINEIIFLEKIAPYLVSTFHKELKKKVVFPKVLQSKRQYPRPFILLEHIKGSIAGKVHFGHYNVLAEADLDTIVSCIKLMQAVPLERLKQLAPELHLDRTIEQRVYQKYLLEVADKEQWIRPILGSKDYRRLLNLLKNKEDFLYSHPMLFSSGDINLSNIIKTNDGKLGLIDWERVCLVNSPALDYSFVFAGLVTLPKLQRYYYQKVLAVNTDIPNFAEFFRLEFLFNRGGSVLSYWVEQHQLATTPEERQHAVKQVKRMVDLFRDALNREGMFTKS